MKLFYFFIFFYIYTCYSDDSIFYVSNSGNNTSSCGSENNPCLNISYTISKACSLSPNITSTIFVQPGIYNTIGSTVNCSIILQSVNGSTNTIINHIGPNPFISAGYSENFTFDGFTINSVVTAQEFISIEFMDNIIINDLVITIEDLYNFLQIQYSSNVSLSNIFVDSSYYDYLIDILNISDISIHNFNVTGGRFTTIVNVNNYNSFVGTNWVIDIQTQNIGTPCYINGDLSVATIDLDNVFFSFTGEGNTALSMIGNSTKISNTTFSNINSYDTLCKLIGDVQLDNVIVNSCNYINTIFYIENQAQTYVNISSLYVNDSNEIDTFFRLPVGSHVLKNIYVENCNMDIMFTVYDLATVSIELSDSYIKDNYFLNFMYLNLESGTIDVTNTTFSNNIGYTDSGLFYIFGKTAYESTSSINITNCNMFDNNISFLYTQFISVTIDNCTFSSNSLLQNLINIEYTNYAYVTNSNISFNIAPTVLEIIYTHNYYFNNVNLIGNSPDFSVLLFSTSNGTIDNLYAADNSISSGVLSCIKSSTLTLSNSYLDSNYGILGSAIYALSTCNLYISDSSFTYGNVSSDGGAMWLSDTHGYIINSNITNNYASNYGGGVALFGNSNITLNQTVFEYNEALIGGCLYISGNTTSIITQSQFQYCNAQTSGGAIVITGYSSPNINNCIVYNNFAGSSGSGILALAFCSPSITSTNIKYNYSPNIAAGMYLQDKSSASIHNVTFYNNIASSGAGLALNTNSSTIITNSTFENNYSSSKGGAIASTNRGNITLYNTIFINNTAKSGGGLYLTDTTTSTITLCSINNNTGTSRAGAIYISSEANLYIYDSNIESNSARNGNGGAILTQDLSYMLFNNTILYNNYASYGGGLYIITTNTPTITYCNLTLNQANYDGGAIYLAESTTPQFSNNIFQYNIAINGNGGGIFTVDNSTCLLQSNTFTNNEGDNGGALSIEGSSTIQSILNNFSNNVATNGGAVYVSQYATFMEENSTVSENLAVRGGGFYLNAHTGGGIYALYGTLGYPSIHGAILFHNKATNGGGISVEENSDSSTGSILTESILKDTTIDFSSILYGFTDIIFDSNTADNGGAIYFNEVNFNTPKFTSIELINNNASFGGAVVVSELIIVKECISDANFINNTSRYAASNIGFDYIIEVDSIETFCNNCSFIGGNTLGYQTSKGFATLPNSLKFNSSHDGCPSSVTLSTSQLEIDIFAYDKFNTPIKGPYIIDYPILINLNYSSSDIHLTSESASVYINSTTGYAGFNDIELCGPNNSTILLEFTTNNQSISDVSCSILLYGCEDGYEIVSDEGDCAICKEKKISQNGILIIILVGISLGLLFLLLLLLTSFFGWKYWQKRKRDKLRKLEIPDFSEKPSLTLHDILNDSNIPRIEWNNIEIETTIGKGASGLVSRGTWKKGSKIKEIALKELIFGFENIGIEVLEEFLIEIKFMSALVHDNIVEFYGICIPDDNSKLYLVTELMHYGSLRDVLDKKGNNLPNSLRLQMAKDTAKGMVYLHSKKLIHRDLKPQNLLINKEWRCKVADFGISTVKPTITREMTCIGTPIYMAPEVLSKNKYSEKADVFSFGIVLYEIFSGERPYSTGEFSSMNQAQLMYQIIEVGARPPLDNFNSGLAQLIRDCWNIDPRLRPSFAEIVVRLRRLRGSLQDKNTNDNDDINDDNEHNITIKRDESSELELSQEYSFIQDIESSMTSIN